MSSPSMNIQNILVKIASLGAFCATSARRHTSYTHRSLIEKVLQQGVLYVNAVENASTGNMLTAKSKLKDLYIPEKEHELQHDGFIHRLTQLANASHMAERWSDAGHNLGMLAQSLLSENAEQISAAISSSSVQFNTPTVNAHSDPLEKDRWEQATDMFKEITRDIEGAFVLTIHN